MKKGTKVWICVALGMFIVTVATIMINALVFGDDKSNLTTQASERINIFDTKFGQTYKSEISEMNCVEFFVGTDSVTGETYLKIKTDDTTDNNIILTHMVYTNLNDIIPNVGNEAVSIIVSDREGMFFKWNDSNLDFVQAFTRKDYIVAVEKKEKMLYNHSVRTE